MLSLLTRPAALLFTLGLATILPVVAEEPAKVTAQPDIPAAPIGTLTLEESISRAIEKNFSLKIQSYNTANAKETLIIAGSRFEPVFTGSADRIHSETGTLKQDQTSFSVGVTQAVQTGGSVAVVGNLDRNSSNPALTALNPVYNSDVVISLIQPLLKGSGIRVNRADIETAKLGITISNLNFKASVLQVVRDTEAAYYTLAFAREQLAVKRASLALANTLLNENEIRRNTGVATDLDVMSAGVGVATAQNGVVLAEQQVANSEDALLALIGQFEFNTPVGEVNFTGYTDVAPSTDESFRLAREGQPGYVATAFYIKQLEIAADVAKRNRLPDLDLNGALGFNGNDRTYNSSFDRLSGGDNFSWQVGLSVSVPWGMRADRARYRTALNNLTQQEAQLQQVEQNLLVQVRSAVRAVETNIESVQISAKATELAAKQYDLQKAKFDAGLSTSREVLQTQTDLETARVNELQAKVNLRIAVANLHQLDGTSIRRYNISL